MILLDYIFIGFFTLFIISDKTRASALVLVIGYLAYWVIALKLTGLDRYGFIAFINVSSGIYLTYVKKDYPMAALFYIAVIVGFIGGVLYVNYYPQYYYDNMCITIMLLQALVLLCRVALNGLRGNKLHSVHGNIYRHGYKGSHKMLEGKKKKRANQCAKS